mgnify:CR=1 FL=1
MMAAILFLCLLIGSNQAIAQDIEVPRDLIPKANFSEQILSSRAALSQLEMPVYRGGVQALINNTVAVTTANSSGAGVVLSAVTAASILTDLPQEVFERFTMIVTNFHVVEEGIDPSVSFAPVGTMDPSKAPVAQGEIFSVVPTKDLALVVVEGKPNHVTGVSLASPGSAQVGDDVQAVGHPKGQAWTYTRGYISQIRKNYSWSYNQSFQHTADVIQTQTPISAGNSGGPLFSRDGTLLGINTMSNQGGQNLNFAVSSTELDSLADAVETSLNVRSVSKYLTYQDLPELLSENYKFEEKGVTPSGLLYQLYTLKADSNSAVIALYTEEDDSPLLAYDQQVDDTVFTFYLSPDHDNPGAYFEVMIVDEEGNTVASGWDFDGDFAADYLR